MSDLHRPTNWVCIRGLTWLCVNGVVLMIPRKFLNTTVRASGSPSLFTVISLELWPKTLEYGQNGMVRYDVSYLELKLTATEVRETFPQHPVCVLR